MRPEYGPPKTLYNRWKRWGDKGVFARMMDGLASEAAVPKTVMIDATYLKAHRTATSLRSKKGDQTTRRGRLIGRTKGGMNTKLHAVTDAEGRPIRFFMTAGQVSDYTGARPCWAACQRRSGCWPTGAMTLTGSEMR